MIASLKHDEGETFARFGQYVYMYDYTGAEPFDEPGHEENRKGMFSTANIWRAAGPDGSREIFGVARGDREAAPTSSTAGEDHAAFTEKTFPCENPYSTRGTPANVTGSQNCLLVFLCHARVYVFADKYAIDGLKNLALQKLHSTLCLFKIYPQRVIDIAELLRYVYQHTRNSPREPLRALLMQYVACKAEVLDENPEFRALLLAEDTPRQLSCELISAMAMRLRLKGNKKESPVHAYDPWGPSGE